ncbi:TetR family transcriptional regulator [Streptomyces sp. NBC_00075]|uniref:TetR/AcrR family transcriptional regulator n=1 Tax=Streptomyces sp. NBC_00075 TaxID=2975641 RepID=UPI003253F648
MTEVNERRERARADRAAFPDGGSLSGAQVLDAALALIDREGMDALSMRKLADSLGVYPATIYWHVGNKNQLIAKVCQRVFDSIELAEVGDVPWTAWIRQLATSARTVMGRHPSLAAGFTSTIQVSASSLTLADRLMQVLEGAGFRGERLVMVYNTVLGTIFGWISAEFATELANSDSDWTAEYAAALNEASDEELPAIRRNLLLVANRVFMLRWTSGRTTPMEGSFDFMVETMIAGLERMLERDDRPL